MRTVHGWLAHFIVRGSCQRNVDEATRRPEISRFRSDSEYGCHTVGCVATSVNYSLYGAAAKLCKMIISKCFIFMVRFDRESSPVDVRMESLAPKGTQLVSLSILA